MNDEPMTVDRLQAFAENLESKRKEAVKFVESQGVHGLWDEDERFYEGLDELNSTSWEKGRTPDSPLQAHTTEGNSQTRSRLFVNITKPYVDMAAARAGDVLLPTDEMPFDVGPTPEPEMVKAMNSNEIIINPQNGQPLAAAADVAKKYLEDAKERAEKAETQIYDWWDQWNYPAKARQLINGTAKIGVSVLKGPFPSRFRRRSISNMDGEYIVQVVEETRPASDVIDPRDFFPDKSCGNDIHSGRYVWQRDRLSAKTVRGLKDLVDRDGQPIYIASQIDEILKEGPNKRWEEGAEKNEKDKFEIWYYYGEATAEDLAAAGCECDEGKSYPAIVTTINGRVIQANLQPLDSGEFPFDVLVWEDSPEFWWGTGGVARQVRTPQRMVNAATRAMMDNAGLSSGPMIVMMDGVAVADNGPMAIRPRLMLRVTDTENIKRAQDAVASITINSMQGELMNIVNFGLTLAERITGMTIQQQGMQGENPETAKGREILQNNAGSLMRRICKMYDDRIKPHVHRYYEWILQNIDDAKMKGDFEISVKASSVFYERDVQNQLLASLLPLSLQPAYEISPKKTMEELIKSQKLSPSRIQFTEEEKTQMAEKAAQQQPPVDPRIEATKIKAESDQKIAAMRNQTEQIRIKSDTDRDNVYNQTMAQREANTAGYNNAKLEIERAIKELELATEQGISLQEAKVQLAKTTMELNVTKELAQLKTSPNAAKTPTVKPPATPPIEPPGRAEDGRSYEQ